MAFENRRGRDRLLIVSEIIGIVVEGALKTQVMYLANLSFTQLNDYLKFLLEIRMIEKVKEGNKEVYRATQKGLDFRSRYLEIQSLVSRETASDEGRPVKQKVILDETL